MEEIKTPDNNEKLDFLVKEIESLKKKNEMLLDIADQSRLGKYLEKHRKEAPSRCHLATYKGKVIIGWRTVTDEVYKDASNRWVEKQIMELVFEDQSTEMVDYQTFTWRTERLNCSVESREIKADGSMIYNLLGDNGQKYSIDTRFLNPF